MKSVTPKPIHYVPAPDHIYTLTRALSFATNVRPPFAIVMHYAALNQDGLLTLRPGFSWDGPSGPCPALICLMRASAGHDAFCRMIRAGSLPKKLQRRVDRFFYRIAREDATPLMIATVTYLALLIYDLTGCASLDRALYEATERTATNE